MSSYILALDVGEKRIGLALSSNIAKLPQPHGVILRDENSPQTILELVHEQNVSKVVVGLPRGLEGQETPQTSVTREFIELLKKTLGVPVYTQDEALTSKKAKEEFAIRGVRYNKGDVDALAATYILEDYLRDNPDLST